MAKPRRRSPAMSEKDLAAHDIELVRAMTAEHPVQAVMVPAAPPAVVTTTTTTPAQPPAVQENIIVTLERQVRSWAFWAFGMFLEPDDPHKPSMGRILLALWTYVGWLMLQHEINLLPGQPAILNAAWTAWWAAEGVLAFKVFGPDIASYFGAGAAGAAAATAIGSAARDAVMKRRDKAAEAGSDGTEFTE